MRDVRGERSVLAWADGAAEVAHVRIEACAGSDGSAATMGWDRCAGGLIGCARPV